MTTYRMFILFKKTDFNTTLACLGGKVHRSWGGHKIFVAEIGGGRNFIDADFWKFGTPLPKKMIAPLGTFEFLKGENTIFLRAAHTFSFKN